MSRSENNMYLGEEKIYKLLLKFSIPCILSLLVSSLYNIVDQIFIGNSELGYLGNAATTVVFPITVIAVAFAWCFGDGAASYLSICQGKKDTKNIHKSIGSCITALFIISIIFVLICALNMDNILYLFGASEATIEYARSYCIIILCAMPIYMLMNMMNSMIRADGSPGYAMAAMCAGAIINIILDPIFIFVFKMGIEGAAYATIIGQTVTFIVTLIYFIKPKSFKLSLSSFIPDFKLLGDIIKLGASTFITQMAIVITTLVCNMMLVKYGALSKYGQDIPIAVIGIAMKVFTIVINIVVGIVLGGQPIIGFNYGARNYKRVKETYKIILLLTLAVGSLSTAIFLLCPQVIINLFGAESELYNEFAVITFRTFLSMITCSCVIKMTSIFFQAVGHTVKATVASLARDILCFVPLAIILPLKLGVIGILLAAPIADFISILIAIGFSISFLKSLSKGDEDETLDDRRAEEGQLKLRGQE